VTCADSAKYAVSAQIAESAKLPDDDSTKDAKYAKKIAVSA